MNQQTCNPAWLDAFLKNELNESEEQMLTSHLDECSDCREELESRAAEQSVWREASNLLGEGILLSTAAIGDIRSGTVRSPQIELVLQQLAPTDDPESLGRIGGYEVTGVVGAGGMGVVLKAHDRSLDRIVAIKVMSPHLASSGSARRRFAREAKAAAAVLHPNVIAIHSVASEDANPFLVMPYVRGASLQKRIDSQGPLPLKDTLRIGAQIAAGLAAAHEQGLVHRDIKPANILLEEGVERVTITDFGLARAVDDASMTCSGVIAGTPQYMSPEQTRGEPIDARSDLFSLGSVLYAMCAGRSPFRAETTYGVLHRIANDNPTPVCEVNSDVPEWLGHIIERLIAKRPEVRFETAAQVAELLEGCLAHVQQPAVIPLPLGVQALAAQSQLRAGKIPKPNRLKAIHQRIPPFAKYIAAAAGAVALFFAGILIVLELGKGTLTIESELDDVPIRIMQGEDVVKSLTVSKEGATTRIGAGKYIVEIGQEFDKAVIKDSGVELSRGATAIVKVTQTNADTAESEKAKDEAAKAWLRRPMAGRTRDGKSYQLAGHDALMDCVMRNNSETLNRLLTVDKYDLDFSPRDGQWTLLQIALLHECVETTSLLLQHGANPTFASKGTPLPLELAQRSGRPELVLLVQEYIIALDNADPQAKEDKSKEASKVLRLDDSARVFLQGFTGDWKLNAISYDGGKFRNVLRSKMSATIKPTLVGSNLEMFNGSQQIGPAYEICVLDSSTYPMQIILNRIDSFLSLIIFEDEVLTLARPIRPGEPRPQSLQPAKGIVIYRWTRMSEQAHDRDSFVTIPLKAEWVPEDWLKRNMGRRHLTIVADGNIQDEAKPNVVSRVQRGILHDCRLESYEKMSRDGVEYWNATFFVPRKPVYSIGALWFKDAIHTYLIGDRHTPVPSPDLTQDNPQVKLDEALAEGHSFRLDDANEDDGTIKNSSSHTNNLIGTWKPHSATEKTWHSDDIRMAHEKLERPQSNPHIDKWTLSFSADGAARFTGIEHYLGAGPESPPMTLDTWLTREFDFQGKWDLRDGMLSIITDEPAVKQWKLIALTESQLVLHHETRILKVVDGKQVPETVDVIWVKQKAKSEAIISDAAVTVPPMEFDTLEDFLKPGRELFDKEMKQIDERLAKVVEGSAEHSLLTTKKKQLQQQWDLSVAQVKGMAAAAKAGKPVQLAPIVIPNNSRPWQAPMPDPLLGHDEDIAEVLAGTWQVKRYVTDGEEAPLDGATVTFSKNMMTMHYKLGDEEGDIQQVYRIGSDKIDIWHRDSGPDMRTALPYLGSYSLENDTLRICYHNRAMELETPQSRPPVQPGKGFIYLELQRDPIGEKVSVAKGKTDDRRTGQSYQISLLVLADDDLQPVAGATVDVTLIVDDNGVTGDGGFAPFKTNEEGIAFVDEVLWPGRYQINVRAPKDSRFRDTEFSKEGSILVVHEDGRYSPREFRLAVKDEK